MSCLLDCFDGKKLSKERSKDQNKTIKDRLRHKIDRKNIQSNLYDFMRKSSKINPIEIEENNGYKSNNKRNSDLRRRFLNLFNIKQKSVVNTTHKNRSNKGNNDDTKKDKPHWEYKDRLRCLFCGGSSCKHEDWKKNSKTAIKGINCDYITKDLIASQRPSTILLNEYDLIKRFKEERIGLIVNLQREGEHPYCGPNGKLEHSSGFTYDPEAFISEDINVKLSGWKDMSVPDSLNFVLETVKEMASNIKENKKKVLVHCHAGYGRTGVIIACYLLFDTNMDTVDAVNLLRKNRPGTIQKKSQYQFCQRFKEYIARAKKVFFVPKISIEQCMKNQKDVLFGEDFLRFEFIPKILFFTLEKIIEFKNLQKYTKTEIYNSLFFMENWTEAQEESLNNIKKSININNWEPFRNIDDIFILSQLFYDWLDDERGLELLINKHIQNQELFEMEDRNKISELIKNELRTIEYESLLCLSYFANELKPDIEFDKNEWIDYYNMLRRFSIQILGFPSNILLIENKHFKNHMKIENEDNIYSNIKSCLNTNNNLKEDPLNLMECNFINLKKLKCNRKLSSNRHINVNRESKLDYDQELFNIKDNIISYADSFINLIEFFSLIIKLDLNDLFYESPYISSKISNKVFSPYRNKSIDIDGLKRNSFIGSRFAINLLEKESKIKVNKFLENKNSFKENDKPTSLEKFKHNKESENIVNKYIFEENIHKSSSDSFSEAQENEENEKNFCNFKIKPSPILQLKQCIMEDIEYENNMNYVKDKSSNIKTGLEITEFKHKNNSKLEDLINKNRLFNLNEEVNIDKDNIFLFKEIYNTLHNYFSKNNEKIDQSNGPSLFFDVSKDANYETKKYIDSKLNTAANIKKGVEQVIESSLIDYDTDKIISEKDCKNGKNESFIKCEIRRNHSLQSLRTFEKLNVESNYNHELDINVNRGSNRNCLKYDLKNFVLKKKFVEHADKNIYNIKIGKNNNMVVNSKKNKLMRGEETNHKIKTKNENIKIKTQKNIHFDNQNVNLPILKIMKERAYSSLNYNKYKKEKIKDGFQFHTYKENFFQD